MKAKKKKSEAIKPADLGVDIVSPPWRALLATRSDSS